MKNSWVDLGKEKFKELGEFDFGHLVAILITSASFLLLLLCSTPALRF